MLAVFRVFPETQIAPECCLFDKLKKLQLSNVQLSFETIIAEPS